MRTAMLLVGLLAMGCGGNDGSAVSCSPDDRLGTYLVHFTKLSGSCPDVPDFVSRVDTTAMFDVPGCAFDADDRWSEGNCKFERAYRCIAKDGSGDVTSAIEVTTQQDSSGSLITGIATFQITTASGAGVCIGTYNMSYTRQ